MAIPDTHFEDPPLFALLSASSAIRSVAPWSLWKGSSTRSNLQQSGIADYAAMMHK